MEGWREPVKAALSAAKEIYPQAKDLLLEEIDLDDNRDWLITVSFSLQAADDSSGWAGTIAISSKKIFKQFVISQATNQILAMKIRNAAG
jgi:hypothetical protein